MHVVLLDSRYDHKRFPFATETPAFLLPVVHRSLLRGTLAWLGEHGLGDVTLVTERNPAEDFDLARVVVDHQLRLAGSVDRALARLHRTRQLDQSVLIMRPNLHPLPSLGDLCAFHSHGRNACSYVKGTCVFGPGSYSFGPPVVALLAPSAARLLLGRDSRRPLAEIPRLVRARGLSAGVFEPADRVVEINNPFSLFQANLGLIRGAGPQALENRGLRQVRPKLWVADGADIGNIEVDPTGGPVLVGVGSRIADRVLLRGPTVFDARVVVEPGACVHRGLILDGTWLAKQEFIASSVVSPNVRARIAS